MKLNKIVGLGLAIALGLNLVGCQSTTDSPTEMELNQSEQVFNRVYQEVEESLPYECMEISTYGDENCDIYWAIDVDYIYDSYEEEKNVTSVTEEKERKEEVVNKMIDYHKEINKKYNPLGIKVIVKVCYPNNQFEEYYLITDDYVEDNGFIVED